MSSLIYNHFKMSCGHWFTSIVGYHAIIYSVIVGCHADTESLSLWDITDRSRIHNHCMISCNHGLTIIIGYHAIKDSLPL